MESPKPKERRRSPRHRLGRLATIQLADGSPKHFCLVTDISEGGVRLHVNGFHAPDVFMLLFPADGPTQSGSYKVVWRTR
jgi:sarcosine oxidase gamma subunit